MKITLPPPLASVPNGAKQAGLGLFLAIAMMLPRLAAAATPTVDLGSAAGFAILGGSAITFTAPMNTVSGDVGLSPGSSITGSPANLTLTGSSAIRSLADSAQAQIDSATAYAFAAGQTPFNTVAGNTLGGLNLGPGVYRGGALDLTGVLTLTGDANSVWIFQADSSLVTASSSRVELSGGADPCNVFWQVTSSATLGSGSFFDGTILALASISLGDGVTVDGRLLAQTGAVTLIHDTISVPNCTAKGPDSGNSVPDTGSTLLLLSTGLASLLGLRRWFFSRA